MPRRRLLVLLVAVPVLLVAVAWVLIDSRNALEPGSQGSAPPPFDFEEGRRIRIRQSVRNRSELPLTLKRVSLDGIWALRSADVGEVYEDRRRPLATGYRLGRGQEALLVLDLELRRCGSLPRNARLGLEALRITYDVLGLDRSVWLDVTDPVVVRYPHGSSAGPCPEP